jgi:hypothetical protein
VLQPIKDARQGGAEGIPGFRAGKALLQDGHPRPAAVFAVEGDLDVSFQLGSAWHREG